MNKAIIRDVLPSRKDIVKAIILFFFAIVFKWIWNYGFETLLEVNTKFSNFYYTEVAKNVSYDWLIKYIILLFFIIAMSILHLLALNNLNRFKKTLDKEFKKAEISNETFLVKLKRMANLTLGMLILLPFICYSIYCTGILIEKKNESFIWKLNVISPYINENQVLKLKSDWALMKNSHDYEKINNQLDSTMKIKKLYRQ